MKKKIVRDFVRIVRARESKKDFGLGVGVLYKDVLRLTFSDTASAKRGLPIILYDESKSLLNQLFEVTNKPVTKKHKPNAKKATK
jgi:hypothetical protein